MRLIAAAGAGLNARWIPVVYIGANLTTIILIAIALFSPRLDLPHAAALGCLRAGADYYIG